MKRIPDGVLDQQVEGINLRPAPDPADGASPTLRAQLDPGSTILAFLRHLG